MPEIDLNQYNTSEPSLKQKTAKGLFWGGISNGVQQLLGVVFGIFLARILNADDYGLVAMLAIFSGIGSTIINSGFSTALTNNVNAGHKEYNAVFWFSFFTGAIIYLILFFSAPLIADFFDRPELLNLARVLFISLFVGGLSIVPHTILFKKLRVKDQAKIDITAMLLSGIVGVSLAINGFAYWALAMQSVTYVATGSFLRFFVARWKPTLDFDFTPLRSMLNFSAKLFLTNIFMHINSNIFSVLLGRFYNATQLGYYAQGHKWMGMGHQMISGMINMVVQPVIIQVNDDKERETRVFRKMLRFVAFVTFPAFIGLAYIAKEFIYITIGAKWMPSVLYLQILCVWGITSAFITLFTQLLITHNRSDVYLWGNVLTGIFQLLALFVLYHLSGEIVHMVIGYVSIHFLSMIFWIYNAKKWVDICLYITIRDIAPYLIATISSIFVSLLAIYFIENMYVILFMKVLIVAIIYLFTLWIFDSKLLKEGVSLLKKK